MNKPVMSEAAPAMPVRQAPAGPSPDAAAMPLPAVHREWRKLAFWMRTTAAVSLAFGLFQLFVGLINFGWGTLAGIVEIALAILLIVIGGQAGRIGRTPGDWNEIQLLAKRLVLYFRLQTAFVVLFGFVVVMLVVTILQFLTDWDWLIHLVQQGRKLDKLIVLEEKWYGTIVSWFS